MGRLFRSATTVVLYQAVVPSGCAVLPFRDHLLSVIPDDGVYEKS